jgi:hypothetical protein
VTGDLILFSLVLLGGHYLFSDLSNPTLQTVLAALDVIVLLPLGIYLLIGASGILCGPTLPLANTGMKAPSLRPFSLELQRRQLANSEAGGGMMTWFTALIVVVRFVPRRIGPIFFRVVNTILGLILLSFAAFCAIVLCHRVLAVQHGADVFLVRVGFDANYFLMR